METTQKRKSSVRRSAKHEARLDFRLSREAKERIEKAALASGLSMSDFAASTLLREADEVLERLNVTKLSDRDRDIFLGLLDNPPAPSEDLMQAVADYKQRAQPDGERMHIRPPGGAKTRLSDA